MNSFYGEQKWKDIEEKFACKAKCLMVSEYDERVKNYWRITHGY